ncbi:MAG: hypothetical protein ACXABY_19070 [Candidatus Thorarchaeota archaeon]|jgi:hypothetical protein
MKRTKQWWARLSSLERSELHALERAHGYSVDSYPDDMSGCGACGTPTPIGFDLCPFCMRRRDELIGKADIAIEFEQWRADEINELERREYE